MTPLQQALAAWGHPKPDPDEPIGQQQVDDAVALGETKTFSNRHISLITGLDVLFVGELTGKTDKTGGRFNPEALPFIHDLWHQWATAHTADRRTACSIVRQGVSPGMLSRLTGISRSTIYSWMKEES